MSDEWFIQEGESCVGPHSVAQVHDLMRSGQVGCEAWFGCDDVWIDFESFKRACPEPNLGPTDASAPSSLNELADSLGETLSGESESAPERDAILILGRRRAGKTVYLATLYASLWKSPSGLTMKSLSGPAHKMLMIVADQLKHGQWPDATLGTRQLEFEVEYRGAKYLLVAFDYSGEDFRRAFIDEDASSPEVKKLLNYVDRASAVILLMDPSVMVSGKHDEIVDDDFGMVQAVQRIRNWPGGREVPIVIALTKADRNKELLQAHGTAPEFVLRHYPALARTLVRVPIFPVCAVQEISDGNGRSLPKPESIPINIEKPLVYCFQEFQRREKRVQDEAAHSAAERAEQQDFRAEQEALARASRKLWIYIIGFIVLALCGYIVMYFLLTR